MLDIKWDNQCSLGNERIDLQHHAFIDSIRSSSDAVDSHLEPELTTRALEELALYAKFHFFAEGTLMINSHYPRYELHRKEHVHLLETLDNRIDEFWSMKRPVKPWSSLYSSGSSCINCIRTRNS